MSRRVEHFANATLYLGDCQELIADVPFFDAVVTDPPYGINHSGNSNRFSGGNTRRGKGSKHGKIVGDEGPFDPSFLIELGKDAIIFGANNFPHKLFPGTLLVWSKRRPAAYGSFLSDGEVAWFSKGRGVYMIEHIFSGSSPALDAGLTAYEASAHPFQKPVKVMEWCLGFVPAAKIILDPYMGAGSTGVASLKCQRQFVGIEIDEKYFDAACRRIEAEARQFKLAI